MRIFKTLKDFREWRREIDRRVVAADARPITHSSVGFVPTMGALHAGHRSLLARARKENEIVVLSIFVNPTQFNRSDDFEKYPKTIEADLALAESVGVDAVLLPEDSKELYPDDYRYRISENQFSGILCGAHRPGHFEGVLTVVMKLLQLARPTRAYFGEKDFQQLALIRGMVEAFFMDTEIVPCATLRESDGLAMSSRNLRLNERERAMAPELHRAMTTIRDVDAARAHLAEQGFLVDYLEDRSFPDGSRRRFAAASLGSIRLIDNVEIGVELPEVGP